MPKSPKHYWCLERMGLVLSNLANELKLNILQRAKSNMLGKKVYDRMMKYKNVNKAKLATSHRMRTSVSVIIGLAGAQVPE